MSKNSDPKVPFTTDTITKCICPECPVQNNSPCVMDKMEKLPKTMNTAGKGTVPNSQDVPGVYCSTGIAACKDIDTRQMCICGGCAVWQEYDLKSGEAAYSPAHHADITTPQELKEKINWLRNMTDGIPIGAKLGCGNIEKDVKVLVDAGIDFIALDGFGGGTGATDLYLRENVGIPIFAALPRAFKVLSDLGVKDKISLVGGGGLRTSADFAKCLALGADAVYIGSTALIAINCEH